MPTLGGFNWVDISILILVAFGSAVGYAQGLLRQVMGLAALYIAAILGAQYYLPVSNFLHGAFSLQPSRWLNTAVFFLIFFSVTGVINLLAADAYRMTKLRMFPLLDQLGGSILGLVTMVVLLTLMLSVLLFVSGEQLPYLDSERLVLMDGLQRSRLLPIFTAFKLNLLDAIGPWLPAGLPSIFNL